MVDIKQNEHIKKTDMSFCDSEFRAYVFVRQTIPTMMSAQARNSESQKDMSVF